MKRLAAIGFVFFIGLMSSVLTPAQDLPKQINGGVLNGKAISLPKPPYPPAARAVGASGAVSVQVLIDTDGNVEAATAVSGHPLLRAAAVEAARGAKFTPTLLSGQPVRVSGIITYNFVGPLHLARIAFVLSHAEATSMFGAYSAPESLAYQLPNDWEHEKQILNSLTFEPAIAPANPPDVAKIAKPEDNAAAPPKDKNRYTIVGSENFSAANLGPYGARKLDAKSRSSVTTLSGLVETRAGANSASAWTYDLGRALGAFVAEIDDASKTQSNLSKIESLASSAPSGVVQYSLDRLKEFIEFAKKEELRDENRTTIVSKAEALSVLRY